MKIEKVLNFTSALAFLLGTVVFAPIMLCALWIWAYLQAPKEFEEWMCSRWWEF